MPRDLRILVTGAGGQLGSALAAARWAGVAELAALPHGALDIADEAQVSETLAAIAPDLVVNAAAFNAVDRAEQEPHLAWAVNRDAPARLAAHCARSGASLIHFSSDYVFDGARDVPYRETDEPAPLGVYGQSKLQGERAVAGALERHLILRTSWVFGRDGDGFLHRILQAGAARGSLDVVADQWSTPTPVAGLVALVAEVVRRLAAGDAVPWGLYHFAGSPPASRLTYTQAIFEARSGAPVVLRPVASADFPAVARRPRYSALDSARAEAVFGVPSPSWREALPAVVRALA
ncbi:MAG: dTDP-4-dehydrorhamnose reductase [Polyangiaceae bacterium]